MQASQREEKKDCSRGDEWLAIIDRQASVGGRSESQGEGRMATGTMGTMGDNGDNGEDKDDRKEKEGKGR